MDDYQIIIENKDFQIVYFVDRYQSFIWTDRYYEPGDFEIYMPYSTDLLEFFKINYYLWFSRSEHMMIIDTIKITSNSDEGIMIIITGQSLESILKWRLVLQVKTWDMVPIQDFVEEVINNNFINPSGEGFLSGREIAPKGKFRFERSSDPYIENTLISYESKGDTNFLDILTQICSEKEIGFKVILDQNDCFVLSLYVGTDRSFTNENVNHVEFSESFENIMDLNYSVSEQSYRNAMIVGTKYDISLEPTDTGNKQTLGKKLLEDFYYNGTPIPSPAPYIPPKENPDELPCNNKYIYSRDWLINYYGNFGTYFPILERRTEVPEGQLNSYQWVPTFRYGFRNYDKYLESIKVNEPTESNEYSAVVGDDRIMIEVWEGGSDSRPKYLDRREVYVSASDVQQQPYNEDGSERIKLTRLEVAKLLHDKGTTAISENQPIHQFEGQVDGTGVFKYDEDFFMGDVVQITSEYNIEASVRIVEFIWSIDQDGINTYPTLKVVKDTGTLDIEEKVVND